MPDLISSARVGAQVSSAAEQRPELRKVAVRLEASFLAQMLKEAGLGKAPEAFGGGVGEEQFASFLTEAQAQAFAERGGIGLADKIYESLLRSQMEGQNE